jgi:hypothetical protein
VIFSPAFFTADHTVIAASLFQGTVLRDFLPVFIINQHPQAPDSCPKYFRISFRIRGETREYALIIRYAA